jgi:hypothetical protein
VKRRLFVCSLLIVGALGVAAGLGACGSVKGGDIAPTDAGSDTTPFDAAIEDADTDVTDPNLDLDGGPDDFGPDGGPCNLVINDAPAITSTCASSLPLFSGGSLVDGRYFLTSVTAWATSNYCQARFIPVGMRETMELTVDGGVATAETVLQLAGTGPRHRTATIVPGAKDSSPAQVTSTCPVGAPGQVRYHSSIVNGKHRLSVVLPYGAGLGIYILEKQ